jgi:hypothetical protein
MIGVLQQSVCHHYTTVAIYPLQRNTDCCKEVVLTIYLFKILIIKDVLENKR